MKASVCTLLAAAVVANTGGALRADDKPVSKSNILNLYHQIQGVKFQVEVEKILGKPVFPALAQAGGVMKCWYVDQRESGPLAPHLSPWGPAGIVVTYDAHGKVLESKFNSQWVKPEHLERYRREFQKKAEGGGAAKP